MREIFEYHELPKLEERLKSIKNFEIHFSEAAKDIIVDLSFDKNGGGRKLYKEIDRLMNSCIVPALTEYKGEKELLMTVENNNIVAKWQ